MLSINFEKFSGFYSSKIEPLLYDLEKERKKCVWGYRTVDFCYIIFGILFLGFPIFPIFIPYDHFLIKHYEIVVFSVLIPVVIGVPLCIYIHRKQKQYIRKLKLNIYKKLFKLLDLNYSQSASINFADYQNAILKHIPTTKLWSYVMRFEDGITGVFKDIPFELCDAKIARRYETQYHDEQTIFQGLLLAVKVNKSVKGETVIKSDNFKLFKIDKNVIKLEDTEFNKGFKVLADSEVEARYIITTSFMERLKNFHKNKKDKTIIFFDSSCSESKNMFILTNTGRDNFEIPFYKSILNEKYYYNLLKELVDMLEIAVALKLEQNIGL